MLKTLELGINRKPSHVVPGKRPIEQYNAVEQIVNTPGYEFACSNPFTSELFARVRCTFIFMYFVRVNGDRTALRAVKITPKGKIVDVTPPGI